MPYYEVTVTATKTICVKADNESEAEGAAEDSLSGDWNRTVAEAVDEYDPATREDHARFVKEYKEAGDYLEA